jgi:hypothetical protein
LLTVGDKSYSCSGIGSTPQCIEMPSVGGVNPLGTMMTGYFGAYSALLQGADHASSIFGSIDKTTSDSKIAGRKAKCVTIKAGVLAGASGSVTVCIDAETGVLLRAATDVGGSGRSGAVEATSFATSTADDVKLPAQPTSIPGLGDVTTTSY